MSLYRCLLFLCPLSLLLSGCRPSRPPCHLYIGLDASLSARSSLGGFTLLTQSLAAQIAPGQDHLTLFRVDQETREFVDGVYDGDSEAMLKTLVAQIQKPAAKSGTYPARFWQQVGERVKQDPTPSVIFLMSDGDNDDFRKASWQTIAQAGKALAACPEVRAVVLCGAHPQNWQKLRQALAPLGNRLHLLSPTQLQPEKVLCYLP